MARGKASLGEKTVVDAVEAVRVATEGLNDPTAILGAAIKAVNNVVERMRGLPNMAGRARIWSQKSIGLDDPGMVAFKLMIESLKD